MTDIQKWYVAWSPFWEFVENRHLSIFVTEKLLNYISSPVLIIGAGQGLIVEYLRNKGFIVDGIDIEKEMIRMAKKRRSIDIILADAKKLPFKDKSYKTVIIASGIVDYLRDDKQIKQIIDEGLRVTAKHGNLFISFYQITPVLEKIYKKIGVIDSKNQYHMKRIFDIDKMSRKNPLTCISPIKKWTNKKLLPIFLYWTKLGLTLPKELKEERKKTELMFDTAKKNNIDVNDIYESIPDSLPYREVPEIKKLLKDLGYIYSEINKYNDCIIVKFHKSGSFNLSMDGQQN
ncbi:MAG: class I SAM-dependent methyltransferase, partial [Spirochaetes bacterium]|nr:class I SAM-dependent methyltransferase [Spirochaetota bacterium]